MATFLTQAWFDKVTALTTQAGNLNLSPALKSLSINLNVTDAPEGQGKAAFYDGNIHQGLKEGAATTLNLDTETLRAVFLERDMNRAMEAFMTGKIKVDGDMGQLMAIQTAQPSAEQKQLFKNILEITE